MKRDNLGWCEDTLGEELSMGHSAGAQRSPAAEAGLGQADGTLPTAKPLARSALTGSQRALCQPQQIEVPRRRSPLLSRLSPWSCCPRPKTLITGQAGISASTRCDGASLRRATYDCDSLGSWLAVEQGHPTPRTYDIFPGHAAGVTRPCPHRI